ncbi:MAG: AAA family ATPase [Tannerellaceae bacterium]|jgi:exonuclease SbcC|nr:AAA family ATPase [Tannerellaceae bacterium]
MKILAIRGKNIASIEGAFELDFTVPPLSQAGIFAITGNTGSGKSTILDVLCLALFDNTPRMSHAGENNIFILDAPDRAIHQKDCRTLLRRGTADGYAEVDFQAVSSERYRATWMVKRARGKTGGSLQNSEMSLVNLSTHTPVQGRKTFLLARVVELTGLTFEQFTRTVLLPQGDFATFLKARQSEKAELLEKLTGTGIYSRISVIIYEKTKDAVREHLALTERIKDVEQLTHEEIASLTAEKEGLEEGYKLLEAQQKTVAAKIKWLDDRHTLDLGCIEALRSLEGIEDLIVQAQPRYEYLARTESVQDIRDIFNELQLSKKQLEENIALMETKTKERLDAAEALKQADEACRLLGRQQEELEREIELAAPEIIKARELDILILGAVNSEAEAGSEYLSALKTKQGIEKNILAIENGIRLAQEDAGRFAAWLERHAVWENVVAQSGLILALLDDTHTALEQSRINTKRQAENTGLLTAESEKLDRQRSEALRLNSLLPAEVLGMRARLEDGHPCPVCGSTSHPAKNIAGGQSMREAELDKARQTVDKEIERLTLTVEERRSEITRLKALADNYSLQAASTMEKAATYLSGLPLWKTSFEDGLLQKEIREMTLLWTTHTQQIARAAETVNNKSIQLKSEQDNLARAMLNLNEKEKKRDAAILLRQDAQKRRSSLLGGEKVERLTAMHSAKKKEIAGEIGRSTEHKNKLLSKQELIAGMISRITAEVDRLSRQCASAGESVDIWIEGKQGSLTREQLPGLLSRDNNWLQSERAFLFGLKEKETALRSTLQERRRTLTAHDLAEIKPQGEDETRDILLEKQSAQGEQAAYSLKRIATINATLAANEKGKERIQAFEGMISEKAPAVENWKRLNELFGSATGSKFKEIAQGYTLDVLLTHANRHLRELSRRYELQRIAGTLALMVSDLDMLGETRTVHSLSGGESFLVSLALALGLASLMTDRMNIESMFIDEGFGSLDLDTFRVAMDALEKLQMKGHKIGVISHVAEMTERIATQVLVIKTANGRSHIKITGKSLIPSQ